MRSPSILISGAGIGGPTLAWWLLRSGITPTIVERAPAFREGGYMIDFWGVGFDVAERMDLLPRLRARGYLMDQVQFVDERGRLRSGFGGAALRQAMADRFFSILRGDLARVIYDDVQDRVETIFGDSIVAIEDRGTDVLVTFERGAPRTFDLVVGADGLHSVVRNAVFGEERRFEKYMGYYCASFTAADYPHRDEGTYLSFAAPGRQASRYALRDNRTAFFFVFTEDQPLGIAPHDVAAQRAVLHRTFGNDGWECADILRLLDSADDFFFDAVSQIRMPEWSRGRVALLGDAAYCPSLLAGQGSAFAMTGAYLLAGELESADGDHARAFRAFEAKFRPFLEKKQKAAEGFAGSFAPRTNLGLFVRDQVIHLMAIPAIGRWMTRRLIADRFDLPSYGLTMAPSTVRR